MPCPCQSSGKKSPDCCLGDGDPCNSKLLKMYTKNQKLRSQVEKSHGRKKLKQYPQCVPCCYQGKSRSPSGKLWNAALIDWLNPLTNRHRRAQVCCCLRRQNRQLSSLLG